MNLILEQFLEYKSDKEVRCDATELFFGNADRKELVFTHNEVVSIFKARFNKLYENDDAVYFEVVDAESGELMNFTARKTIHELMIKYLLYPPIIQKLFT